MALAVGVSGVKSVTGVGRMCTGSGEGVAGSGLLVAWAVALGFNFMGNGLIISFWSSSTASFPLPSSVSNGEIASSILDGQKAAQMSEDSDNPSKNSVTVSIRSSCSCCLQCSSTVVLIRYSSSGFSSSW